MNLQSIKTLGELKKSGYQSKSIKDELRENLISKMLSKESAFNGVHGYENTVIPELERAILSRHNINLLGLRGQAKTRLARQMILLLDEWIPVIEGSEILDEHDEWEEIHNCIKEIFWFRTFKSLEFN